MEDRPMNVHAFLPPANDMTDYAAKLEAARDTTGAPQFFRLAARLPVKGRSDTILAATGRSWVVIKACAEGGENALHAHPNDEHVFVVLQRKAEFVGPKGERRVVETHDGVIMPAGTYYMFQSVGAEPLVMLRVGYALNTAEDPLARINPDGSAFDPFTEENRRPDLVLSDTAVFP
jgi:mannose-6-phosphate isomerase-like protein (cupin superfamily)